jgi:predicted GNAT superfamily acetyltransferase
LETDRLLVEWHLDSARVVAAIENLVKDPGEAAASVELPAELERWQREDSSQVGTVQARLREEFARWFAKGYAAIGFRRAPGNRAYLLAPWSDF